LFGEEGVEFRRKFKAGEGKGWKNVVNSDAGKEVEISPMSFVEWSSLQGPATIEEGCIISGVHLTQATNPSTIPFIFQANRTYITFCLGEERYVTTIFPRDDDLKAKGEIR